MKNNRNGQAQVLTKDQLEELLGELSPNHRLSFGICYYTSCRVSEALQLQQSDLVGDRIVFRASTTKTKRTREVKIPQKLAALLEMSEQPTSDYLFLGKNGDT